MFYYRRLFYGFTIWSASRIMLLYFNIILQFHFADSYQRATIIISRKPRMWRNCQSWKIIMIITEWRCVSNRLSFIESRRTTGGLRGGSAAVPWERPEMRGPSFEVSSSIIEGNSRQQTVRYARAAALVDARHFKYHQRLPVVFTL